MAETPPLRHGFVCEIGDNTVKLFDWRNQLVEVSMSYFADGVELGNAYKWDETENQAFEDSIDTFDVFVRDGVVCAKVFALAPVESILMRDGLLDKYRYTAYSHMLQLLNDPQNLFFGWPNMEVAVATVKYSPSERALFEVIDVEEPDDEWKERMECIPHLQAFAPWSIEKQLSIRNTVGVPPEGCSRFFPFQRLSMSHRFLGVWILIDEMMQHVPGKTIKQLMPRQVLYSWTVGLLSSNKDAQHAKVGQWVNFQIADDIRRKAQNGTKSKPRTNQTYKPRSHFSVAEAKGFENVTAPIPTSVDERGHLKMITNFQFDYDMLEAVENRTISNWEQREQGFSKTAHFYCTSLGKIEIYPRLSGIIIKSIETHFADLKTSGEYEKLKNEKICVEVEVILLKNGIANFLRDPSSALFMVSKINKISYLTGGRTIEICTDS